MGLAPCLLKDQASLARAAENTADTDGSGSVTASDDINFSANSHVVDEGQSFFLHAFHTSGDTKIKAGDSCVHGVRLRLFPPPELQTAKRSATHTRVLSESQNRDERLTLRESLRFGRGAVAKDASQLHVLS